MYSFPKISVIISFGKKVVARVSGKITIAMRVLVDLLIMFSTILILWLLDAIVGRAACPKLPGSINAAWHTEDGGL
jgi:hypothetical protein